MRHRQALRYQDLASECLQLGLEFLDHVFKLVFILDWSDAHSLSFQLGCGIDYK